MRYMVSTNGFIMGFNWADAGTTFGALTMLTGESPNWGGVEGITSGDTITSIFGTATTIDASVGALGGDEIVAMFQSIWGTDWSKFYVLWAGAGVHTNFRNTVVNGNDIITAGGLKEWLSSVHSITEFQAFNDNSSMQFWVYVKGSHDSSNTSPEGNFPSVCNNSLVNLRWDGVSDVDVFYDGAWHLIDNTITTQALLKAWLEAIYPDDNYLFAYHVNSGEICVDWQEQSIGTGSFTFSVDLQDQITIGDEVEAYIIAKRKRDFRKWLS